MEGEKKTFKPTPSFRNELMHRRRRHHHPFRSIMQKSNQQFIYGWGRVERMGENDYRTRREREFGFFLEVSRSFSSVLSDDEEWSNNFEKCIEGRLDVNLLGWTIVEDYYLRNLGILHFSMNCRFFSTWSIFEGVEEWGIVG